MKKYIKQAYDKAVLINNNGFEYEFYTRIDRRPTKIVMAFDKEHLDWALERNKKYMEKDDLNELWELIDKDKKPFWMGKGSVIINWTEEKRKLLAHCCRGKSDDEANRFVNEYIAELKIEHQEIMQESLEGAYHKRVRLDEL